ncbi:MAG: hypothetical protein QF918_06065 [Pirellulaceae bacterium]|nr:hypothetical protein [Pirellulaceae bacterium]
MNSRSPLDAPTPVTQQAPAAAPIRPASATLSPADNPAISPA